MLRAKDGGYLEEVVERVKHVAEGAALEMGARVEITLNYPMYKSVLPNAVLAKLDRENAEHAGLRVEPERGVGGPLASTDLGNVSLVVPTHAIRFAVSDQPVAGHSRAMTEAAATPLANENALGVARALAMTALDLLADPEIVRNAHDDFEVRRPSGQAGEPKRAG
jgi:metal-dependent amidase/aminoacylase/carboxypeptidase family protein